MSKRTPDDWTLIAAQCCLALLLLCIFAGCAFAIWRIYE